MFPFFLLDLLANNLERVTDRSGDGYFLLLNLALDEEKGGRLPLNMVPGSKQRAFLKKKILLLKLKLSTGKVHHHNKPKRWVLLHVNYQKDLTTTDELVNSGTFTQAEYSTDCR